MSFQYLVVLIEFLFPFDVRLKLPNPNMSRRNPSHSVNGSLWLSNTVPVSAQNDLPQEWHTNRCTPFEVNPFFRYPSEPQCGQAFGTNELISATSGEPFSVGCLLSYSILVHSSMNACIGVASWMPVHGVILLDFVLSLSFFMVGSRLYEGGRRRRLPHQVTGSPCHTTWLDSTTLLRTFSITARPTVQITLLAFKKISLSLREAFPY